MFPFKSNSVEIVSYTTENISIS